MIFLKIGGSVLTDKAQPNTMRDDNLHLIAREIAETQLTNLVLVHGAGSFGHPQAAKYLSEGFSPSGVWKTHRAVASLNAKFVNALQSQAIPVLPIHPFDTVVLDGGKITHFDVHTFRLMLNNHIIPVLHGDVVIDRRNGFSILSGDQIVAFLAQRMRPEKIGMGTDVDGIIYKGEKMNRLNANEFEKYREEIAGSTAIDVTGGMLNKVSLLVEIAKRGIQSEIFNATCEGNVAKFLTSRQDVGTKISAEKK